VVVIINIESALYLQVQKLIIFAFLEFIIVRSLAHILKIPHQFPLYLLLYLPSIPITMMFPVKRFETHYINNKIFYFQSIIASVNFSLVFSESLAKSTACYTASAIP
jgi:hypothetical protein